MDIISTASLLFDIGWITDKLNEGGNDSASQSAQLARAGRASRVSARASRLVRIIRLVRLIRIVKLYKHAQQSLIQKSLGFGDEDGNNNDPDKKNNKKDSRRSFTDFFKRGSIKVKLEDNNNRNSIFRNKLFSQNSIRKNPKSNSTTNFKDYSMKNFSEVF